MRPQMEDQGFAVAEQSTMFLLGPSTLRWQCMAMSLECNHAVHNLYLFKEVLMKHAASRCVCEQHARIKIGDLELS